MARKTTTRTSRKTTSARKTAAGTTIGKPTMGNPVAPAKATMTAVSQTPQKPATAEPATVVTALTKRDLVDRIVESSGIKKKSAKPVVEAMLRELGEALSRGETLNLHPLGKAVVKNRKDLENAEVIELRLRRSKQALAAGGPGAGGPASGAGSEADSDGEPGDGPDGGPKGGNDPLAEAAE